MTECDATQRETALTCSFEDRAPAARDGRLDLDRVVWDPEYRDEVRAYLRGET